MHCFIFLRTLVIRIFNVKHIHYIKVLLEKGNDLKSKNTLINGMRLNLIS